MSVGSIRRVGSKSDPGGASEGQWRVTLQGGDDTLLHQRVIHSECWNVSREDRNGIGSEGVESCE